MREFDRLKEMINDISGKIEEMDEIISDFAEYGFTTLRSHKEVEDYEKFEVDIGSLKLKIANLENEIKKIKTNISGIGEQIPRISVLENDLKTVKTVFEKIWDQFSRIECNYAGLKDDRDKLSERIDGLEVRTTSIKNNQEAERKRLNVVVEHIDNHKDRIDMLEKKVRDIVSRFDILAQRIGE